MIFIFTCTHERLTPQCVCVCSACVWERRSHACEPIVHLSWFQMLFSPHRGDRESVVVTSRSNNKAMIHTLTCRHSSSKNSLFFTMLGL